MEGNLKEYLNNNIIGNVRTGTRGEKDNPVKLAYFDVHTDKTTSELAVEIFNGMYKNPNKLQIKFVSQTPMNISLQRYEKKRLKCYGNGKEGKVLDDNGKRQTIECNPKECIFKKNRQCKFVGRLYFIIHKLEDEGLWCYPIGSEKGIKFIWNRIARANRINEDLTKDWYELYLKQEDAVVGKNYIPDIRKIETVNNENVLKTKPEDNNKKISNSSNSGNNNFLMIKGFQAIMYEKQKVTKIICVNTSSERKELILMPNSKQDILKLNIDSIFLPVSISKRGTVETLNDYKIIKEAIKKTA